MDSIASSTSSNRNLGVSDRGNEALDDSLKIPVFTRTDSQPAPLAPRISVVIRDGDGDGDGDEDDNDVPAVGLSPMP